MSCAATLAAVILLAATASDTSAVAADSVSTSAVSADNVGRDAQPAPPAKEHPLMPILRYASQRYQQLEHEVRDYTCTLVKHERVRGRLLEREYLDVKIRHEEVRDGRVVTPLSVYILFTAPEIIRGREVIYERGRYDGQIIVHNGGPRFGYITTAIDPAGDLAMQRNRYPITEIGIQNLIKRLIEVGTDDIKHDGCEVKYYTDAKINGRKCTMIEIVHPVRREYFTYHIARIFVDDEMQLPVRYAAYDWPDEEGGSTPLMEEYTYVDLKLNVGLTDWDFDYHNPAYGFRKDFTP